MSRLNSSRPLALVLILSLIAVLPSAARAENEGQGDLDKATQLKLGAQSTSDLTDVIVLCESALKKGLDKGNTAFANDLMASALVQRGNTTAAKALNDLATGGNWKRDRTDALADLEKGVKLNNKQPQAFHWIAKLNLLPEGDAKRATEALDQAIALSDDEPAVKAEALVLRASMRKNFADRLADLNAAVKALPDNAAVLRIRGATLADTGRMEAALDDLNKSIAIDPQPMTYQLKALVLVKLKKYDEALPLIDKALRANPENADLLVIKAQALLAKSDFRGSLEAMTKALEAQPDNLGLLELRAAVYEQLGERRKALADIEKILKLKPELPAVKRQRAVLLAELGKNDEAAKQLEEMHKADPKDMLTLLQLGLLHTGAKQYDKAVDAFTKVLAVNPDDAEALRGRGDAHLNLGHREKALADYEKAYGLKPHDPGILNNFAWLLATAPEAKLRNGTRAVAMANEAARLTDYKADFILSTLAAAYAETGDFESARKWAGKANEVATKQHAEDLNKELESYKKNKPWREALPAADEWKDLPKKDDKKPETKADPQAAADKPAAEVKAAESKPDDAAKKDGKSKAKKKKKVKKTTPPAEAK